MSGRPMAIFGKPDTIEGMPKPSSLPAHRSLKDLMFKPWGPESAFFWMLTAAMALIGVTAVLSSPRLQVPARLLAFTVLMTVHTGLH